MEEAKDLKGMEDEKAIYIVKYYKSMHSSH